MKQFQIYTSNDKDRKNLLIILYSLGLRYNDYTVITLDETCNNGASYPYTIIYDDKTMGGNYENYGPNNAGPVYNFPKQLNEIYYILTKEYDEITIENVGDYTAIVREDIVKVGCQEISHDKVIEIYEAIQKVKKA